jgi:hypothetical protein
MVVACEFTYPYYADIGEISSQIVLFVLNVLKFQVYEVHFYVQIKPLDVQIYGSIKTVFSNAQ